MEGRFEQFTVLISNINRNIRKIKTEEMKAYNLKSPHVSCLYYLYRSDSLTARELCDLCEEDKANISRSIKYLEENGYVCCDSKAKKRYLDPIVLTEKGQKVGKCIAEKVERILDFTGNEMSEEERENLYRCLTRINDVLQEICDKYENE